MRFQTIFTLAFAAFALARDDDPASSDAAASPAEDACYSKTLATGSGAAAAIKGFCAQVEGDASDSDNPTSKADVSVNGYTAGGFPPSGISTTAKLAAKKGCNVDLGDEEECLERFWEVCQKGDKFGRGVAKKGCMEFKIE